MTSYFFHPAMHALIPQKATESHNSNHIRWKQNVYKITAIKNRLKHPGKIIQTQWKQWKLYFTLKILYVGHIALLDLCAAFDSVDHDTSLRRLQTSFGLGRSVISCFIYYLSSRSQCVGSKNTRSRLRQYVLATSLYYHHLYSIYDTSRSL